MGEGYLQIRQLILLQDGTPYASSWTVVMDKQALDDYIIERGGL